LIRCTLAVVQLNKEKAINITHSLINIDKYSLSSAESILEISNFIVHDAVNKVALMGSRGLQGGFRPDSDIDVGLILSPEVKHDVSLCEEVLSTTQSSWTSDIELDVALVFDKRSCSLACYEDPFFNDFSCGGGVDCIGLYKNQKGFNGYIGNIGIEVTKAQPIVIIWSRYVE